MGEWMYSVDEYSTVPSKKKDGKEVMNAFVKITVSIGLVKFSAFASHPVLDDVGDAFKSAQTDAMKKALSHFSIGNRAYHGLLPKNK